VESNVRRSKFGVGTDASDIAGSWLEAIMYLLMQPIMTCHGVISISLGFLQGSPATVEEGASVHCSLDH